MVFVFHGLLEFTPLWVQNRNKSLFEKYLKSAPIYMKFIIRAPKRNNRTSVFWFFEKYPQE